MLSVQLSIIKLVFKDPCVVKARFCPLDTLNPVKMFRINKKKLLYDEPHYPGI